MKESEQQQIFHEWLDGYRGLIFKIIRAYAFNTDDLNDLFQEVCLQVFRSIPNFKAKSAVSTWIYRISLNTAINWSTREKKRVNGYHGIETMANLLQTSDDSKEEKLNWLYAEIKKLNEIDRSLTLLLLDGYSYKEMAEIMGISENNIGVKIHRIKKQLVKNAKQYEYD
jgi:RNA polymerase sigma-70 factor (ECF subfamily)